MSEFLQFSNHSLILTFFFNHFNIFTNQNISNSNLIMHRKNIIYKSEKIYTTTFSMVLSIFAKFAHVCIF